MTENKKERTSITIDPDLFVRVRDYCAAVSKQTNSKVSFSEIVGKALTDYLGVRTGSINDGCANTTNTTYPVDTSMFTTQ